MSVKILRFAFLLFLIIQSTIAFAEKPILDIKKWSTSLGTTVLYVQEKELPMIDIQVVFDAGSARDYNQPGLSKITNMALVSGTTTKNADQVAASFEDVGARFSAAVNRDMAAVSLRSLSNPKYLQPALNTFVEVLTQPSFAEQDFLRIQRQVLSSLEEQEEQPAAIATKAFYGAIYDNNPYGHPITGSKESVSKLTAKDLSNFYKSFYTASNALIAIVGDIDINEAKKIAEMISKQLKKGEKPPVVAFGLYQSKSRMKHIPYPSSQTHVLIGQAAINRNDPAYFPVIVGNYVLGGGMLTSRLFDEVREKRGLAYSVYSQFSALKEKGPFIIELQTRNKEVGNAIKVVNNTLDNFVKAGPSPEELLSAKKNLTEGFTLRLATNSAIIGQLINIGYYQLPLNYLDTYKSNILKVSDQQVREVFQKIIHPEQLVTVTVGNNLALENAKQAVSQ